MRIGSGRAATYNPILPKLDLLIAEMKNIGDLHNASVSQIAVAYAINKGTYPIIGVTKPYQVEEAAAASTINLTEEEMSSLERLAEAADVDTKSSWENPMV